MNGTAVFGETVVVIQVDQGDVRLKTGRIVSDGSSVALADNRHRTVVSGGRGFGPAAEADEVPDGKEFRVDDIHLLKAEEAASLRDPARAQDWFGSVYQDWVVSKIQRALKRLKL
jgi:hypothetical protein